jgi:hypothetical protein
MGPTTRSARSVRPSVAPSTHRVPSRSDYQPLDLRAAALSAPSACFPRKWHFVRLGTASKCLGQFGVKPKRSLGGFAEALQRPLTKVGVAGTLPAMTPQDEFIALLEDHFGDRYESTVATGPDGDSFVVLTLNRYPRGAIHVYEDHLVLVERGHRIGASDEVQVARHSLPLDHLLAAIEPMQKLEWVMGAM